MDTAATKRKLKMDLAQDSAPSAPDAQAAHGKTGILDISVIQQGNAIVVYAIHHIHIAVPAVITAPATMGQADVRYVQTVEKVTRAAHLLPPVIWKMDLQDQTVPAHGHIHQIAIILIE